MANKQKFSALTGRLWRSHGCFLSDTASSMGRDFDRVASSCCRNCQTWILLSRPCLFIYLAGSLLYLDEKHSIWNVRDNPVLAPTPYPEDATLMGSPHSHGAADRHIPQHDPAVGVAGHEAEVVAEEVDGVDLGGVAAQHIGGLSGW